MLIRTVVGCYYNKKTTVCACGPTHTFSSVHTHAHARSRTHVFSSVGLHFLIRTHTRARLRTRGVLRQGTPQWTPMSQTTLNAKDVTLLDLFRFIH